MPLIAKQDGVEIDGDVLSATEQGVIDAARAAVSADSGLEVYPAGPGALLVAFIDAFEGIDGTLLLAALGVVVLILLVVYRSPVLWIFPLLSAVLALGIASLIVYYLAKHEVLTLNGQSQGILSVLVIGAGTDYALLLISRYREELHTYDNRFDAMIAAWKGSAAAIVASGSDRHGRTAVSVVLRTELEQGPRPDRRDRHRLHPARDDDVPAGRAVGGGTVGVLAAHPAPRPRDRPRDPRGVESDRRHRRGPAAPGVDRRDGAAAHRHGWASRCSTPTG